MIGDYYDQYSPEDVDAARPIDDQPAEDDEDAIQDFVLRNDEQQSHGGIFDKYLHFL